MKIKYISYETAYNRHIRAARKAAQGLTGWPRAETIRIYFAENGHPHARYTFDQMAMDRRSDRQFAIDLLQEMADLTAKNQAGYLIGDRIYRDRKPLGYDAYLYDEYAGRGKFAVHCETKGYNNTIKIFDDVFDYEMFVDSLYTRSNYQRGRTQTGILIASFLGYLDDNYAETKPDHMGCKIWLHDNEDQGE